MPAGGVFEEFRRHLEQTLERHEEWMQSLERRMNEQKVAQATMNVKIAAGVFVAAAIASGLIGALMKWGFNG